MYRIRSCCSKTAEENEENKKLKPSFHMIAHNRRIIENTASDYMETLFSDRAIVSDRQRSYALVIPVTITKKCFHMIADDRPIAEKCFHMIADDRWQYIQRYADRKRSYGN